ncbi:16S rRNA (guanine(527)-N(7))-methyltransferase RsmG [Bacteroidota bacterium]
MKIIQKYFPDLSNKQIEKFTMLADLYSFWNKKINVISRKDIHHLYEHHVLHSAAIAKIITFLPETLVLDAGTGGGFPGIPLSILFPETNFVLVDSIMKKIKVVNEVITSLNLQNVQAKQIRIEEINNKYDFIVSRAITTFPDFVNLSSRLIRAGEKNSLNNGIIYLKGGNISDEIKSFKNRVVIYNLSDYFNEEFFITKKIIYLAV